MPLLLARFQSRPNGYFFQGVRCNGNDYGVRVWYGPAASREDKEATERLVRSLEFRPLVSP